MAARYTCLPCNALDAFPTKVKRRAEPAVNESRLFLLFAVFVVSHALFLRPPKDRADLDLGALRTVLTPIVFEVLNLFGHSQSDLFRGLFPSPIRGGIVDYDQSQSIQPRRKFPYLCVARPPLVTSDGAREFVFAYPNRLTFIDRFSTELTQECEDTCADVRASRGMRPPTSEENRSAPGWPYGSGLLVALFQKRQRTDVKPRSQ